MLSGVLLWRPLAVILLENVTKVPSWIHLHTLQTVHEVFTGDGREIQKESLRTRQA